MSTRRRTFDIGKIKEGINKPIEIRRTGSIKEELDKNIFTKFINFFRKDSDFFIPIIVIGSLILFILYQINSQLNDNDPMNDLMKKIYLTIIPIFLIFTYIFYITFDGEAHKAFFMLSISGLLLFFVIYGLINLSQIKFNLTLQSLFSYIFIIAIILFGLSIFYNLFQNQLRTTDTWGSFFIEMIFYIPCMIDMFIKYMTKDYANTSTQTIIMFIIEIVLIIGYLYLYPMYQNSIYNDSVIVLKDPVRLNNIVSGLVKPLRSISADKMETPTLMNPLHYLLEPDTSNYQYRRNYAISMWVYVNPMPTSRIGYAEETNIFFYGNADGNSNLIPGINQNRWQLPNSTSMSTPTKSPESSGTGDFHPRLSMIPVENNYMFNFYYSGTKPTHQLELPLQKWNNIVFNYVNGGVDVFINGELKLSYNFSEDIPQYSENDDISVGDTNGIQNINANGLYGSICNVVYYKTPLTKRNIVLNYNMLVINNPPLLS
jgi:hypothetical protein